MQLQRKSTSTLFNFKRHLGVVLALLALSTTAQAMDDVNVRFSWKFKGEYAHMYLAQDMGFYKERKLNVRMGEGAGAPAALGALLQGQEDVVVMPAIFALSAIQKGMPVKIIALYHEQAPIVLISHPENPVLSPKDLVGKNVAHSVGETGTSYLGVLCTKNKIDCGQVKRIQMDAQSRIPQFLQKKVDVVSLYVNNDLPILEARIGTKFPTLDLAKHGLNLPGLAAVSSDAVIARKPDVLRRYLAATNAGIDATRKDPKAATASLVKVWQGSPATDIIDKQVRATIDAIPVTSRAIGWIESKVISEALELLQTEESLGQLKPINTFFTNDLLPVR
jgi:NitT/TauT family transport system substrate-binding protein